MEIRNELIIPSIVSTHHLCGGHILMFFFFLLSYVLKKYVMYEDDYRCFGLTSLSHLRPVSAEGLDIKYLAYLTISDILHIVIKIKTCRLMLWGMDTKTLIFTMIAIQNI